MSALCYKDEQLLSWKTNTRSQPQYLQISNTINLHVELLISVAFLAQPNRFSHKKTDSFNYVIAEIFISISTPHNLNKISIRKQTQTINSVSSSKENHHLQLNLLKTHNSHSSSNFFRATMSIVAISFFFLSGDGSWLSQLIDTRNASCCFFFSSEQRRYLICLQRNGLHVTLH